TTASFVSGEYFGLAIKLHLTQLGVQLLGCSPAAPPGIINAQLAKNTTKITINVFTHVFSRLFAIL
ncbi:hypothetical protein, partial [Klebsiella pneumoniae]|uniref:hypothetical protein n=3 Tax=Klebsiella pneumoniae TaxID=573 RepID=UPI001C0EF8F0